MELNDKIKNGPVDFMLKLSNKLYKPGSNFVVSPFSLISAMSMLLPGTGGNSRFQLLRSMFACDSVISDDEFRSFLNVFTELYRSLLDKNQNELSNANMLYSQHGFELKKDYVDALNKEFKAVAKVLDFINDKANSINTINNDANTVTKGLIPEIIQDIDPSTRVILMNAIYFKGEWEKKFDKDRVISNDFTKSNGEVIKVPTMCDTVTSDYVDSTELNCSALKLNYSSKRSSMVFVLPKAGTTVEQVLSKLDQKSFTNLVNSMTEEDDIVLKLPKFKISSQHMLVHALHHLGISDVFSGNADLSKMSDAEKLFVSDVIQKAVIEVNEEGTVAAAVTSIMCRALCFRQQTMFVANRPFLFFLVGDDRTVLFNGVVEDPTQ